MRNEVLDRSIDAQPDVDVMILEGRRRSNDRPIPFHELDDKALPHSIVNDEENFPSRGSLIPIVLEPDQLNGILGEFEFLGRDVRFGVEGKL